MCSVQSHGSTVQTKLDYVASALAGAAPAPHAWRSANICLSFSRVPPAPAAGDADGDDGGGVRDGAGDPGGAAFVAGADDVAGAAGWAVPLSSTRAGSKSQGGLEETIIALKTRAVTCCLM